MKKILPILALLLALTGCNNKWTVAHPDMPEGQRAQYEQSIKDSESTLTEDPTNIEALFNMAFAYDQLGDYNKAVDNYQKVLDQNPNETVSLNNMANIYEEVGEYEQAAEYIKKLYTLNPTGIEVIRDTIRILLEANDPTHAQEALENFVVQYKKADDMDSALTQMVSDLFQNIQDYVSAHPVQQ